MPGFAQLGNNLPALGSCRSCRQELTWFLRHFPCTVRSCGKLTAKARAEGSAQEPQSWGSTRVVGEPLPSSSHTEHRYLRHLQCSVLQAQAAAIPGILKQGAAERERPTWENCAQFFYGLLAATSIIPLNLWRIATYAGYFLHPPCNVCICP